MKKLLFLVLLLSDFLGHAQYTLIPDVNFEQALISLGIDSGAIDGKVLTANVSGVTDLNVSGKNITDLTGIEDFNSLTTLLCYNNQLTNLNLNNPSLTLLFCGDNQLTSLNTSKNLALKNLWCGPNQLTSLDVSKNTALEVLLCYSNQLTSLDVSKNAYLNNINCFNNQLTSLNLKNGGNNILTVFNAYTNPNLTCIQVDNAAYSNSNWNPSSKDATASYSENCNAKVASIAPPVITATGNQSYCPATSLPIVETVNISFDPLEPTTDAVYIQISSGYIFGQDQLTLTNLASHPTVSSSWIPSEGKLKLYSASGNKIPYADFEAAIRDVVFSNPSIIPSGTRTFSISLGTGQLSYLPSNKHFYEYVPSLGITWTDAKAAATVRTYYGLQGYLATITSAAEAQLAGAQAPGAGWIGGTDVSTPNIWKWVTGPEGLANGGTGTVFWNSGPNGSTPTYANWNAGEPNNPDSEFYTHIVAPGTPNTNPGSWNNLSNSGNPSGDYQPKGYVVEYGGMVPGDVDNIHISASTTITMAGIASTTPNSRCGSGTVMLNATAFGGTVNWYDAAIGGNLLGTANSFTTPVLATTTTYYADAGCPTTRIPVTATIYDIPTITSTNSGISSCGSGSVTVQANASIGTVNWYDSPSGGNLLATGTSFITPILTQNTTYYAEANNNNCVSLSRIPVDVKVYTPPIVANQKVTLCESSTVELDAELSGMLYLWSTGETTQKITVSTTGIYSVVVTSPAPENCSSTKEITVVEHNIPVIDRIDVNETTVVIYLKQEEPYFEFSVDGINYQSSNVFFNVQSGLQMAYVREVNFCSRTNLPFIVLIAPKFFTPNGDTYNDVWEVKGLINYPNAEVTIFDRYGKFIVQLNASKLYWDGTLNNLPLPADDYWYVLKMDNTSLEKRGHFSLKR